MNRKWIVNTTLLLALTVAVAGTASAATKSGETSEQVTYSNNGTTVVPSTPAVNMDGSLYLPVRALGEAMGKYVDWDEFRNSVSLTDKPTLTNKYELKAPDLAAGIKMGVGSSLTHLPGDPENVFTRRQIVVRTASQQ